MKWKEYRKTDKFKRLEAEAIELSNRVDEIYKEIEKDCPLPVVGNEKSAYYSLAARNVCISRFNTVGWDHEPFVPS